MSGGTVKGGDRISYDTGARQVHTSIWFINDTLRSIGPA